MKKAILFFLVVLVSSCKMNYKTVDFSQKDLPPAPDYSKNESWAVLPSLWNKPLEDLVGIPEKKQADVFYVYPTLFSNKKNRCWNANIFDQEIRRDVIEKAVTYQASAWVKAANLYVPFYRQAHYRIFLEPYAIQGRGAGNVAYKDVKNAFLYFLKKYNDSRPIIIASHSQGTLHAKRIIKEFFDGKPLQKKLIAAYLIGARVTPKEFKNINELNSPESFGGFISWNTYKINHLPPKYNEWYKGGVVSNPITWDQNLESSINSHLGVLGKNKKIYPKSLYTKEIDGILWSSLPKVKNRFLLSFIKDYHFADINLFWKDIEENAVLRTQNWLVNNQK